MINRGKYTPHTMPFSPTPIIQSTKKTRETKQQKSIIKYTIACQLAEQRILSFGSRLPVEKELYFCCICSGRPQLGQFFKEVSTSFPQSGHIINAIIVTLDFVSGATFFSARREFIPTKKVEPSIVTLLLI